MEEGREAPLGRWLSQPSSIVELSMTRAAVKAAMGGDKGEDDVA